LEFLRCRHRQPDHLEVERRHERARPLDGTFARRFMSEALANLVKIELREVSLQSRTLD